MTRTRGAAAAAIIAGLAAPAIAEEIISNLPGNDGTQSASLEGGRIKAMGFTLPAGPDLTFERAEVRLDVSNLEIDPLVRIYEDAAGVPGEFLLELTDPAFIELGIQTYSFTPPAPLVLEAGRSYWLVVYNNGAPGMDWKASSPAQTPSGIASHYGSLFSTATGPNPPTASSTILNSYAILAQAGGSCYPDCDESGDLDFFDFLCFQNAFAAGDPYADCDESGDLDFFDFLCFQNGFAAGCP